MVVELQVGLQSLPELVIAVELLAPEELALERVEERFHVGVVVHLPGPVHALDDAESTQRGLVVVSSVLDASVRMEDQPWLGTAPPECMLQRRAGQFGITPLAQAPAQKAA